MQLRWTWVAWVWLSERFKKFFGWWLMYSGLYAQRLHQTSIQISWLDMLSEWFEDILPCPVHVQNMLRTLSTKYLCIWGFLWNVVEGLFRWRNMIVNRKFNLCFYFLTILKISPPITIGISLPVFIVVNDLFEALHYKVIYPFIIFKVPHFALMIFQFFSCILKQ